VPWKRAGLDIVYLADYHVDSAVEACMSELIFLVEEAPEGGFIARALGVSIFTEADTLAELPDKVRDAIRCHFDEGTSPKVVRLHHVREEIIAV
jgi:hypothetical protein